MLESIEMRGGNIHCASSRESLMYQSASFNSAVPDTMAILAETIRDPLITTQEIHQQLETAEYEISEIWAKPELILPEMVHVAAYQNNTLGNPLLCPQERLHSINRQVIDNYRKTFYRPERMVVAFAGVDHNRGVKLAEKWFGDMSKGSGATLPDLDMNEATSSNLGTFLTFLRFGGLIQLRHRHLSKQLLIDDRRHHVQTALRQESLHLR